MSDQKQSNTILHNEERYRALFEYAADGIVLVDGKGVFLSVNKAFCTLTGYDEKDFIGKFFIKAPTFLAKDFSFYKNIFKKIVTVLSPNRLNIAISIKIVKFVTRRHMYR